MAFVWLCCAVALSRFSLADARFAFADAGLARFSLAGVFPW